VKSIYSETSNVKKVFAFPSVLPAAQRGAAGTEWRKGELNLKNLKIQGKIPSTKRIYSLFFSNTRDTAEGDMVYSYLINPL